MIELFLDFETSGTSPDDHAPVSLGLVLADGHDIVAEREILFGLPTDYRGKITRTYDAFALELNNTSLADIRNRPNFRLGFEELQCWVRAHNAQNVRRWAYNASFDWSFWQTMLYLCGEYNRHAKAYETPLSPVVGPWQCAMEAAKPLNPNLPSYTLDSVLASVGMSRTSGHHGALEDARLLHRLVVALRSGSKS